MSMYPAAELGMLLVLAWPEVIGISPSWKCACKARLRDDSFNCQPHTSCCQNVHGCRAIVRELARRTGKGRLHVVAFDWRVELDPELDITVTQGSLESKAHLRQLLQGCSAVVHLSTSSQGSVGRWVGVGVMAGTQHLHAPESESTLHCLYNSPALIETAQDVM